MRRRHSSRELNAALPGERYTLAARELESDRIQLNGRELQAGPDGTLPSVQGMAFGEGTLSLPPASSTFLAFPRAGNKACQ